MHECQRRCVCVVCVCVASGSTPRKRCQHIFHCDMRYYCLSRSPSGQFAVLCRRRRWCDTRKCSSYCCHLDRLTTFFVSSSLFLSLSLSLSVGPISWFVSCTRHTHTSRGKSTTLSHCHSLFIIVNRKSSLWKYNYVWCIIMCCDDGVASSSCFVAAKSRHACGGA